MADVNFDLLGDPIPEGFGRRGRPPHVVTDEKRLKVRMLCAFHDDLAEVAAGMGITLPTLKKHYFRELSDKRSAVSRLKATLLFRLMSEAEAGNATAIEKMFKRIDKMELAELSQAVQDRRDDKPKLGKKEARRQAAGDVGGVYRVRTVN